MRDWEQESEEYRTARLKYAEMEQATGKSIKHSWYLAFAKYPRQTHGTQKDQDSEGQSTHKETS